LHRPTVSRLFLATLLCSTALHAAALPGESALIQRSVVFSGDAETLFTEAPNSLPACAAKTEAKAHPQMAIEATGVSLEKGDLESVSSIDLSLTLTPGPSARIGGTTINVLEGLQGELRTRADSGPKTWAVRPGNFGNQAARTNYDAKSGVLTAVLPVLLRDEAGFSVGSTIALKCNQLAGAWRCDRARIVFDEARRQATPSGTFDSVVSSWRARPSNESASRPEIEDLHDCCLGEYRCGCSTCSASTGEGIDGGCKRLCPNCQMNQCEDCGFVGCGTC
jgi:hypothetical protein